MGLLKGPQEDVVASYFHYSGPNRWPDRGDSTVLNSNTDLYLILI